MTVYAKTWDKANLLCAQNLQRVEDNAALMLQGGRNSATPVNCTWVDRAASRAFNTTYTNGTKKRIVIVTAALASDGTTQIGDISLTAVIAPSGANYSPGGARQRSPTLTDRTSDLHVCFVVNPGEEYRINSATTGGGGTATVRHWFEFDFDAIYAKNTWAFDETIDATRLNKYAKGTTDILRGDATGSYASATPADNVETTPSGTVMFFGCATLDIGTTLATGDAILQIKDNGGALTTVGRVSKNYTGQALRPIPFILNANGAYKFVTQGGTVASRTVHGIPFALYALISFAAADGPDTTTGNKLRDLDNQAANGISVSENATRTDGGSANLSRTPSTTRWSIVTVHMRVTPILTTGSQVNVRVDGTTRASFSAPAGDSGETGQLETQTMVLLIIPPNTGYDITTSGVNGTVLRRTEWVI